MELFTLRGALLVGCLCLAAFALGVADQLFRRTQHPETSSDGAFGLGLLGSMMLLFAIAMVAIAYQTAFPGS